jgi:hypothetical protein
MEKFPCYAVAVAAVRAREWATRSFFGRSRLLYGQCYTLAGYFLQQGAILGARHRDKLDAFGRAFLAIAGPPGTAQREFRDHAPEPAATVQEGMAFHDYVNADQVRRLPYKGDPDRLFLELGPKRVDLHAAMLMLGEYALQGAILGATHPELVRRMFECTHAPRDPAQWARARAHGLDIPEKQDIMTYEECEREEDEAFMAYCQRCAPELYAELRG